MSALRLASIVLIVWFMASEGRAQADTDIAAGKIRNWNHGAQALARDCQVKVPRPHADPKPKIHAAAADTAAHSAKAADRNFRMVFLEVR